MPAPKRKTHTNAKRWSQEVTQHSNALEAAKDELRDLYNKPRRNS